MGSAAEVDERLHVVDGVPVRSLSAFAGGRGAHVVVLPGLGALAYLVPFARAVAAAGGRGTVLDLPGFGTPGGLACRPTVGAIAAMADAWVRARSGGDVVLLGHSTGAQAALLAALSLQEDGAPALVAMAGPTFAPGQRSLPRIALTAPAAYRKDALGELAATPDYVRGRSHVLTVIRSAIDDRPEDNVESLRAPLLLTAGRQDAFAPPSWLECLATAAAKCEYVRVVQLPGSHNNPYTHPALLARTVLGAARGATLS